MGEGCLDDRQVAALVAGEAPTDALARAAEHAADCDACRELLAYVGRVRAAEGRELTQHSSEPDTSRPEARPPKRVPATLGRYRVGREIGRGGMGVVHEGHDPQLDRRVAIKVLDEHADSHRLARMTREAQAVAALSHPNVVEIFDVSSSSEPAFIVMELVPGITLREWAVRRRPGWQAVVRAYLQAARGLAAAHAVGLVHRDFKPGNAMIDDAGRVKVLDFGLARPDAESASPITAELSVPMAAATLTATGVAMGTPSYMAPEQHRGDRVDARADIYGLGVALYEALYGRLPFKARTVDLLYLLKGRGVPPVAPDPDVPATIHAAVLKAIAYDPDDRWSSMTELIGALALPQPRRRRAAWVVGGLALAGVVAATIVADPTDEPAHHDGVRVDAKLAIEAVRLVVESRVQELEGDPDRGVGTAMAAVTLAAASGSSSVTARAEIQVGHAFTEAGRPEHALRWLDDGTQRAHADADDRLAARGTIGRIDALSRLERDDEAAEAIRQAHALAERLDDDDLRFAVLAVEARALPNSHPRARELSERVVAIRRNDPRRRSPLGLSEALNNLGAVISNEDPLAARAMYEESLQIRQRLSGDDHPDALMTELNIASLEIGLGEYESCARRARHAFLGVPASQKATRAHAAQVVAMCHYRSREIATGLQWIDRSLEIAASYEGERSLYATSLEVKALLLTATGEWEQAEAVLQRVHIDRESAASGSTTSLAHVRYKLGYVARELGELERAEAYARRSLADYDALDHEDAVHSRILLAKIVVQVGRPAEALSLLADDIDVSADSDPMIAAEAKGVYAQALWAAGDRERALELAREALDSLGRRHDYVEAHDELRVWFASATAG